MTDQHTWVTGRYGSTSVVAQEGSHSLAQKLAAWLGELRESMVAVATTPSHRAESAFGIRAHSSPAGCSALAARATARYQVLPGRAILPTLDGVTPHFLHDIGKLTAGIAGRNPGVRKSGFPASVDRAR